MQNSVSKSIHAPSRDDVQANGTSNTELMMMHSKVVGGLIKGRCFGGVRWHYQGRIVVWSLWLSTALSESFYIVINPMQATVLCMAVSVVAFIALL